MRVVYCDGCSLPIKGARYVVGDAEFAEDPYDPENMVNRVKPIHYREMELCDSCHNLLMIAFERRQDFFLKEAEKLHALYKQPTKTPKHELKKKKIK